MSTVAEIAEALPVGTWRVDPVHSQVGFAIEYNGGTFRGTFSPFEAVLADGTLRGSAKAADIKVQDENLGAHLQSPDFFDAERTPTIEFEAQEIATDGPSVTVTGELTIRGTKQPVELTGTISEPITDPFGRERVGLNLEGAVDRTAFGITWNNPLPSGQPSLANDVRLTAELYLVKA